MFQGIARARWFLLMGAVALGGISVGLFFSVRTHRPRDEANRIEWVIRNARFATLLRKEGDQYQWISNLGPRDNPHLLKQLRNSRPIASGSHTVSDGSITITASAAPSTEWGGPHGRQFVDAYEYCSATGEIGRHGKWFAVPEELRSSVRKTFIVTPVRLVPNGVRGS